MSNWLKLVGKMTIGQESLTACLGLMLLSSNPLCRNFLEVRNSIFVKFFLFEIINIKNNSQKIAFIKIFKRNGQFTSFDIPFICLTKFCP